MSVRAAVSSIAVLAVLLGACTSGADRPGPGGAEPSVGALPTVARDAALAALVPPSVAADGVLVIGATASDPPDEFTDSDGLTVVGTDVDLATVVGEKLGLRAEVRNVPFGDLLPAVVGGRVEMAISSLTVNAERTRSVTMVSYYSAGTAMAVPAGNPGRLSPGDLCGRSVGVQSATVEVAQLAGQSAACTRAGKKPISPVAMATQVEVTLALSRGRVAAMVADGPAVDYAVKTSGGTLEALGPPTDAAPYGIALPKGQDGMVQAVRGAVQALIVDGTYRSVLAKWGVERGAIDAPTIVG